MKEEIKFGKINTGRGYNPRREHIVAYAIEELGDGNSVVTFVDEVRQITGEIVISYEEVSSGDILRNYDEGNYVDLSFDHPMVERIMVGNL